MVVVKSAIFLFPTSGTILRYVTNHQQHETRGGSVCAPPPRSSSPSSRAGRLFVFLVFSKGQQRRFKRRRHDGDKSLISASSSSSKRFPLRRRAVAPTGLRDVFVHVRRRRVKTRGPARSARAELRNGDRCRPSRTTGTAALIKLGMVARSNG